MNLETLINGYRNILNTIYSPKKYYERVNNFLGAYKPRAQKTFTLRMEHVAAFIKATWVLGFREKGRRYYWRLLAWTILKRPRSFTISITLAIYGFHFRKVVEGYAKTLAQNNA